VKIFLMVLVAASIVGGFVGGELTGRTFLLTGAVIGGVGVGAILLGLGGFFSWRTDKKPKKITPEMRAVFERMAQRGGQGSSPSTAKRPADAPKTPNPTSPNKYSAPAFLSTAESLIRIQLLPSFEKPSKAFGSIMTNGRAAGYVFGLHDALLQSLALRDDPKKMVDLMEQSYKNIFGEQAGYALFSSSTSRQGDDDFIEGQIEGGNEFVEFMDKGTPPLGLGRLLIFS
jgi:hypothetical protein